MEKRIESIPVSNVGLKNSINNTGKENTEITKGRVLRPKIKNRKAKTPIEIKEAGRETNRDVMMKASIAFLYERKDTCVPRLLPLLPKGQQNDGL